MNAAQRLEFDVIRREQRELQTRLAALEARLEQFGQRVEESEKEVAVAAMPALTPPPLPVAPSAPVLPPVFAKAPEQKVATAPPGPPPPLPVTAPETPRESLEMQIGTTWLVRVGVVLVLTGLAWMGSHLYYHIVPILGPAAKAALLYLGAGMLTGVGAWLERSRLAAETGKLRDYARVVFAGGLAAVYYVTYAAHWNPHLRVVSDPLLAGALLLGWAAFMVWIADRRGSELLATFAILLAFYTSAVNEISTFTLVANLFLAGGAVYLLRRNLWRIFPFVSLLATFGSYGFWRFSHSYIEGALAMDGAPPHLVLSPAGFWIESSFLLLYWLLFTWAVFTTEEPLLPTWRRAGYVTLNNSAFFLLTTWLLLAAYPGSFWKLSLGFGVVLLALAETSRRVSRRADTRTEEAYLLQGVLLVTLGFVGYFSGWQLGLVLAVQSVVLLWRAGERGSRLLLALSYAVAVTSFGYALRGLHDLTETGMWALGLAEGALLVGCGWWGQRLGDPVRAGSAESEARSKAFCTAAAQIPSWFASLGAVVWLWMLEDVGRWTNPVSSLAGAALLLAASMYVLRLRSLLAFSQVYLSVAHLQWLLTYGERWGEPAPPVWNSTLLLLATLALGHWWQWRRTVDGPLRYNGWRIPAWDALLAVVLLNFWLRPHVHGLSAWWMAEAALLSLAVLGYGLFTRYRALAVAGQLLLAVSIGYFFARWQHPWFFGPGAEPFLALSPLLAMAVSLVVARRYAPAGSLDRDPIKQCVAVYEFIAVLLFMGWTVRYVPLPMRFAVCCGGGAAVFALGGVFREKRWLILSILPTTLALVVFWLVEDFAQWRSVFTLIGVALLAGQQQIGKRWLKHDASALFPAKAQGALMIAAVFCAWACLTARMARWEGSAFTLAASWSLFAPLVFAAGLVLRERVYRWLGLLILAATLGHIILFDVSHLDSLGRAISAFALGIVVLGMGFFYNRYQSKFRDLL